MGNNREGPCTHCGINHSPIWRTGPPEKPVLCNACASRWRNRGTLDDDIPQHSNNNTQSGQSSGLPPLGQPTMPFTMDDFQLPDLGTDIFGYGQSSAGLDEETFANLCLLSPPSSPKNYATMLNPEDFTEPPLLGSSNIPRRKRSILPQRTLSPTERFHLQLQDVMRNAAYHFAADQTPTVDYDDVLIYTKTNKCIPDNEIGLGCVMLPPSPTASDSKAKSVAKPKKETGLEVCMLLNPPSHLAPGPDGKFIYSSDDDEIGFGCAPSGSPTHAIPVGLPVVASKPTPTTSDSKGKDHTTGEDDSSGLVDVPIALSSDQNDTIMLNHVLGNENFPNMNERGQMHEKKFSSHHMTTRSRTSSSRGYKFLEDIYSDSSSHKVKVALGRRRGRPRKHTSQGPPSSGSGSEEPSEFLAKETKLEMLSNDVESKLVLNESGRTPGFVFTATSENEPEAMEDDNPQAP